jgi:hypothetical protein
MDCGGGAVCFWIEVARRGWTWKYSYFELLSACRLVLNLTYSFAKQRLVVKVAQLQSRIDVTFEAI